MLYNSKFKENHSVTKCNNPRCGICDHLRRELVLASTAVLLQLTLNFMWYEERHKGYNLSRMQWIIHCETGNTLCVRVRVHKQHINTPEYRKIALSEHYDVCRHKQFHIFPEYKLTGEVNICKREKEKHFIRTLKPKLNNVV